MKTPLAAAALFWALSSSAQPASFVWLDVREISNNSTKSNTYPTTWGSYDYLFSGFREIEVKVHNSGGTTVNVGIEVLFIGKSPGGPLFIASHSQRQLPLGRDDFVARMQAEFKAEDLNLVLAQYRDISGSRPHGWIVQVWQSGRVIARKASLPELMKWISEHPVDPKTGQPVKKSP